MLQVMMMMTFSFFFTSSSPPSLTSSGGGGVGRTYYLSMPFAYTEYVSYEFKAW
jgi:hypothetical protein